ncbi:MAG: alpha/beta hydrolase [Planctomycetia bacterium]|nr:alpha/beta hydrolase [Planctomycetia bacterium]
MPDVPAKKPHLLTRIVKTAAKTLVASLAVIFLLLYFLQNKLLFYPSRGLGLPPKLQVPAVERVEFNSLDDTRLVSWWLPPKPGRPTVLFFQGNAGNIEDRSDRLLDCQERGWGLLLLGYRGYGESAGSPDEDGINRDARAALEWLRKRTDVEQKKLVYYGESLGCAFATELAVAEPPACLVLEAPFKSLRAIASVHYWWLPTSLLVRGKLDNLGNAPKLKCPLFVAHGTRDEVVPFEHGKAVFDAAPQPKTFYELKSRHNDISEFGGKEYRAAVASFIEGAVK